MGALDLMTALAALLAAAAIGAVVEWVWQVMHQGNEDGK